MFENAINSKKQGDIGMFVLADNGDTYNIPTSSIESTRSINLGEKYQKYKVYLT